MACHRKTNAVWDTLLAAYAWIREDLERQVFAIAGVPWFKKVQCKGDEICI